LIFELWITLSILFFGTYFTYFVYLKSHASKPWNIQIDRNYQPTVSILIPAHNEERNITSKMENVMKIDYPKDNTEIVLVDDASTDGTLNEAYDFVNTHPDFPLKIVKQTLWKGKSTALNEALKTITHDIVIVTDADASWSSDILLKALPYLSDPKVGAITGRVTPSNIDSNWVTKAEDNYLGLMSMVRLGESKIHSTIRFEGCFCAFKRNSFDEFDTKSGADDSGTALKVIQNNFRAILVPEAVTFVDAPHNLKLRVRTKLRRATHLTELWFHCLVLFIRGSLVMPKRLSVPEILISIFNPIIFILLTCISLIIIIKYPLFIFPTFLVLLIVILIPKIRNFSFEVVLDQFILFYSIILFILKRKIIAWDN